MKCLRCGKSITESYSHNKAEFPLCIRCQIHEGRMLIKENEEEFGNLSNLPKLSGEEAFDKETFYNILINFIAMKGSTATIVFSPLGLNRKVVFNDKTDLANTRFETYIDLLNVPATIEETQDGYTIVADTSELEFTEEDVDAFVNDLVEADKEVVDESANTIDDLNDELNNLMSSIVEELANAEFGDALDLERAKEEYMHKAEKIIYATTAPVSLTSVGEVINQFREMVKLAIAKYPEYQEYTPVNFFSTVTEAMLEEDQRDWDIEDANERLNSLIKDIREAIKLERESGCDDKEVKRIIKSSKKGFIRRLTLILDKSHLNQEDEAEARKAIEYMLDTLEVPEGKVEVIKSTKVEESLDDSNLTVYNASTHNLSNVSIENSKELGIHCGTLEAAKEVKESKNYSTLNKVTLSGVNAFSIDADMSGLWSSAHLIHYLSFLSDEEKQELRQKLSDSAFDKYGDEKSIAYSKVFRELILSKGYNTIEYINDAEDKGSKSYIILDTSIIKNVEPVDDEPTDPDNDYDEEEEYLDRTYHDYSEDELRGMSAFGNSDDLEESVEGDQAAMDYIDSKNDNYEKDKEAERQAKVELAKNGIVSEGSENIAYHSTKTSEALEDILTNGFKGDSVFFSSDRFDAEGYGSYTVVVNNLDSLNIYSLSSDELSKINETSDDIKQTKEYDGIKYRYSSNHPYNYEIFNISALNALERYNPDNSPLEKSIDQKTVSEDIALRTDDIIVDMYYGDSIESADNITVFFNDADASYWGNIYKNGVVIGDYSANSDEAIRNTFAHLLKDDTNNTPVELISVEIEFAEGTDKFPIRKEFIHKPFLISEIEQLNNILRNANQAVASQRDKGQMYRGYYKVYFDWKCKVNDRQEQTFHIGRIDLDGKDTSEVEISQEDINNIKGYIENHYKKVDEGFRVWGEEDIENQQALSSIANVIKKFFKDNDISYESIDYDIHDLGPMIEITGVEDVEEVSELLEDIFGFDVEYEDNLIQINTTQEYEDESGWLKQRVDRSYLDEGVARDYLGDYYITISPANSRKLETLSKEEFDKFAEDIRSKFDCISSVHTDMIDVKNQPEEKEELSKLSKQITLFIKSYFSSDKQVKECQSSVKESFADDDAFDLVIDDTDIVEHDDGFNSFKIYTDLIDYEKDSAVYVDFVDHPGYEGEYIMTHLDEETDLITLAVIDLT